MTEDAANGVLAGAVAPSGSTLSVTLVSGPSNGTLTLNSDGSFTFTPDSGWFGTATFVVQVSAGSLTSAPLTETIEVAEMFSEPNNDFRAVATGDFNGDGNADFAAVNYSTDQVYIFLGNGDGTFQTPTVINVGAGSDALAVGNLGNGSQDIVVVNSTDGTITILMNNGSGSFTVSQTLTVGSDPEAVALGDFLGNGSLDIAVANEDSNTVSIFLNNGSGTFTFDTNLSVGSDPDSVAAGDLTGDGVAGLVVANYGSNTISVLLSNGDGTFASAVNYAVGTSPTAVVLADFTGNGILDVAVANGGSNTVSVLMGNGEGTLGTATSYAVGSDPVALAVGDLNSDGLPDLLVANHGSNNLTVLTNLGSGAFFVSQTIALGESPDSVAVTDFANNGILDYVTDAEPEKGSFAAKQKKVAEILGEMIEFLEKEKGRTASIGGPGAGMWLDPADYDFSKLPRNLKGRKLTADDIPALEQARRVADLYAKGELLPPEFARRLPGGRDRFEQELNFLLDLNREFQRMGPGRRFDNGLDEGW